VAGGGIVQATPTVIALSCAAQARSLKPGFGWSPFDSL
jgi:hypothetical protein